MITCEWPTPDDPSLSPFVRQQARFLQAAGVDLDVFSFRGRKNAVNYFKAWMQVRRRLRKSTYDLIHAHHGQSGLVALPKRLPLVVTFHGSDLMGIVGDANGRHTTAGKILRRVSRFVSKRADAAIVVSEEMALYVGESTPTYVVPGGIDLELFCCVPQEEARRHLGLSPDLPLILFVGNPKEPGKRFPLARQAVNVLCESCDAELVVAWNVDRGTIPLYMNACDVMVFASVQEGSPTVVKEALACNLPIVSVAVGDVAERLSGIEGCRICPDDRPDAIAADLEAVLRRRKRLNSRPAIRQLDEKHVAERIIDIYRSVVGKPGSQRLGFERPSAANRGGVRGGSLKLCRM